jgi:hypothetical protein
MPAFDANLGSFSQNTGAATIVLTTAAAAASGSRVIVAVHFSNATTSPTMLNTGGLTWTLDALGRGAAFSTALFSATSAGGLASSTVLTATFNGTATSGFIMACSFTALPGPVNTTQLATAGAGTTWTVTTAGTWPRDSVVYGVTEADTTTTGTNTPSSGTEVHELTNTGYAAALCSEYLIVTGAGPQTLSGTWAGLTGNSQKVTVAVVYQDGLYQPMDYSLFPEPAMRPAVA